MSNLQRNQYYPSSFSPAETASNPNYRNHIRPFPGYDPRFQSSANLGPQERAHSSDTGAHHSFADLNHQARAPRVNAGQGPTGGRSTELGYPQGEDVGQTNPSTLADWQATLQLFAMILPIHPPINQLVLNSAPHDQQAMAAFTPSSSNPDEFLRGLLECFLHSTWMHDQHYEPQMMDDYSKYVLGQAAKLNGRLPIDFNNPKKSLLTVFVGRSGSRPSCLICSKPQDTTPRALSCVRSHLQLKPFRCEGCQACNRRNGYATFWSAALLRGHLRAQNMATCAECGKELRQGNLRRHWATVHKDIEELISFLLEEESD